MFIYLVHFKGTLVFIITFKGETIDLRIYTSTSQIKSLHKNKGTLAIYHFNQPKYTQSCHIPTWGYL